MCIDDREIKNTLEYEISDEINKDDDINFSEEIRDECLYINFTTSHDFRIGIFKINPNENLNDILYLNIYYTTSSKNDENEIALKKNELIQTERFYIDLDKMNFFLLKKNYIVYRDGIRLKNFLSYLFFWTHYETTYVDFYYDNYNSYYFNNITNEGVVAFISNENNEIIKGEDLVIDYYERKYESFFNTLSKWCGMFCTLKILFSSLVNEFSFSYNNYELIKFIDKKNEMNNSKNNNDSNNKFINKIKNIDLNAINNKTKYYNKIKTMDIIKSTFFGCCYKKSKTCKFINDCNNYVIKHISIEEIFYNMLCLENIIEEYNFKDNNHLKKYEEMKNKIELYEKEMNLIDKNKENINQNLNSNLIDKSSDSISMNNINSINE